ncbi:family A G protein-coupled receptor-like protein [Gloeophyllum trabeum ATCC 11539]|uniref:Family A G protein-coupled receptor-like protein n=1 Tax=Gloeophyllum trabeum (strain ATCC 11539 / FP-39264 / Madison 617) TaxID=670483 RepID=S7Q6X3_GLOTA|nr:family A G protein-coupled receptor-like protein [Gloeophyllum trabeum ATCC 11539]EPQ55272.1 family A G protein-coupled receptor-like protein [Gloeophyllum trabeum ATCC 11539]
MPTVPFFNELNRALDINPPNANIHLSRAGSDWLWAVFAVMLLSDLIFIAWSFTRPRGTRVFHQLPIIILTTASIAYFSMASDLGATPILVEWQRHGGGTRQIWYVRYIQWFITAPLLLLELLLATGLSLSEIFTAIFMVEVTVICGLLGALVHSTYKWGYYVFGVSALLYVWWEFLGHGGRSTFAAPVRSTYMAGSGWFSFLLLLYPVCWGLSEGGNVITVTSEMIFYGILDLFAGPFFLFFHLWRLRAVDYAAFGLSSGKPTDYYRFSGDGAGMRGTGAPVTGAPAATGPTATA